MNKLNVAIHGREGMVGSTLMKLLSNHPYVNISPHQPREHWDNKIDVHFFATPAEYSKIEIPLIKNDKAVIIDFSDAFRTESLISFGWDKKSDWYYGNVDNGDYQVNNQIKALEAKRFISMAGCVATSVEFALSPIIKELTKVDKNADKDKPDDVFVTSIIGQSARGKKTKESGSRISNVFTHSHDYEINEYFKMNRTWFTDISVVPIVSEHETGILTVAQCKSQSNRYDLIDLYRRYYEDYSFIEVTDKEISTNDVVGTKNIKISISHSQQSWEKVCVTVVLDNLYAGSASHGIMMMNKKFELPLMTGLEND